jgi:hypothetical protein
MLSTRQRRHSSGPKMLQFDLEQVRGFGRLGASPWEMAVVFNSWARRSTRHATRRRAALKWLTRKVRRRLRPRCEPSSGLSIIRQPDFVCKGCRGGRSAVIYAGSHLLFPKMSQGEYSSWYRSVHVQQTRAVYRRFVGARRADSFSAGATHGQAYSERFGAVRMLE